MTDHDHDEDDDHIDGCDEDFTVHAVSDEEADYAALFPDGQTDEERAELIETLNYLEELDA